LRTVLGPSPFGVGSAFPRRVVGSLLVLKGRSRVGVVDMGLYITKLLILKDILVLRLGIG
jgi:hypothetical protein